MIWWVLGIIFVFYLFIFVYKTKTGSPYVPSEDKHIKKLMRYVKKGDGVADLGAGDGRVLVAAVKAGADEAWGWEIEPLVWLKGTYKIKKKGLKEKVKLRFGDMWRADLSRFDVVFVYQLERYAERFADKCKREMKKGALVIANKYPIKELELKKKDGDLFVYEVE